ncbi:MAG: hypothetical protein M3Z37_07965 [Candidatus Eremiobacteraeota bacterium]|nr:hypothetical protein [Candidatus Eremiobacteraeota bacterium]
MDPAIPPQQRSRKQQAIWWAATGLVALAFFVVSLSDTIYNFTSPPGPFQILLRKGYGVVAFGVLGYLFTHAVRASGGPGAPLPVAVAIGAYSAAIEIGQTLEQAHEGIGWNLIDVACGMLGGALGALVSGRKH